MAKSSAALAAGRLKQLCCKGLGREAITPALLVELRALVPNRTSLVYYIDENHKRVGGYSDNPETVHTSELYLTEFFGRRGRELGGAFPDAVHTQFGVHDYADALRTIDVDWKDFVRSDFYNLIYREHRSHWFMRLMVRGDGGRGRALGNVTLYRGPNEPPWSLEEKQRLAALEPFFAIALKEESKSDVPLVDGGRSGLIVADVTGKPIYFSNDGLHLLHLVTRPRETVDTVFAPSNVLPAPLLQLCRNLVQVFSGDPFAASPSFYHRNIWGGFTFRAQWLEGSDNASGLIGITVSHQEPLQVRMMRNIQHLPLSRRQSEVCLLMANGTSNEAIAEQLGISKHTAIAHGRWIYNKLDVHNRAELVSKLLAA